MLCAALMTRASGLRKAELHLEKDTKRIRKDEGEPVNPPERPEAISQTHHDPYLVNYRNEPMPLRIGQTSALSNNKLTKNDTCPDSVSFTGPNRFSADSISKQRRGNDGDMARVFRTAEHGEPCTPLLETYANERVVVVLFRVRGKYSISSQWKAAPSGATLTKILNMALGPSLTPAKSRAPHAGCIA